MDPYLITCFEPHLPFLISPVALKGSLTVLLWFKELYGKGEDLDLG